MSNFANERRVAEALARSAGKRMYRERREGLSVEMKSTNDPVTNVDLSVERFLRAALAENFPDDLVISEELESNPGEPGALESGRTWLVDPIDGTVNFAHSVPMFCVSIALQLDGESVVGVIYDPSRDELFSASRGQGATLDGAPIQVSDAPDLESALLVTGFPRSLQDAQEDNLGNFVELMRRARGVRRLGSAALDLAYVAAGRLDGFWEYHLNPWDTAAGYLLVSEAGGRVTDAAGKPFTGHEESLLATNRHFHQSLIDQLDELQSSEPTP